MTSAVEVDPSATLGHVHVSLEIRQAEAEAGSPHRELARGVETEEVDARPLIDRDVRAEIQLGKRVGARYGRQTAEA